MGERLARWHWTATKNTNGLYSIEAAQLAVLMDLRDVLDVISRKLSVLECPDFTRIPATLRAIRRNTEPRVRPAKRKRR